MITVRIDEHDPLIYFLRKDHFGIEVEVDEATAKRWEEGLEAFEAIQDEMQKVYWANWPPRKNEGEK